MWVEAGVGGLKANITKELDVASVLMFKAIDSSFDKLCSETD